MNENVKQTIDRFIEEVNSNCKYYKISDRLSNEKSLTDCIRILHLFIRQNIELKQDIDDNVINPDDLKSELDFITIKANQYSYFLLSKLDDMSYLRKIINVNYDSETDEYVAEQKVDYFKPIHPLTKVQNEISKRMYMDDLDLYRKDGITNDEIDELFHSIFEEEGGVNIDSEYLKRTQRNKIFEKFKYLCDIFLNKDNNVTITKENYNSYMYEYLNEASFEKMLTKVNIKYDSEKTMQSLNEFLKKLRILEVLQKMIPFELIDEVDELPTELKNLKDKDSEKLISYLLMNTHFIKQEYFKTVK
jgi:hypothetical protein